MHHAHIAIAALALSASSAHAVTAAPGYIYTSQLLGNLTQGCVAAGPGGTFVGIGPSFTANAQAIVLVAESGELRLVAMGFNSLADCAYERATDTLYVTDNADNADLGLTTAFGNTGAQSGDTVFAIPHASRAAGLNAASHPLLPPNSFEAAAGLALDGSGAVLVTDAAGGTAGTATRISGTVSGPFASGLAFAGGIAVDPATGDVFIAENLGLPNFENRIRRYTAAGALVAPVPFAGPSFAFGSADLAVDADGRLLASGNFGADVVAFDPATRDSTPFASGLTFATGITVDPFTGRVQILSSTFSGVDEDRSLHRFTPIDRLVAGGTQRNSECVHELYGVRVTRGAARCVDGAACDADGQINDSCLFPVGFCFNVEDPAFPECATGEDITAVRVSSQPRHPALEAAAAAIGAALPIRDTTCVFSDGQTVPVSITKRGKRNGQALVTVRSETVGGRRDSDVVRLICQPAA
ncbi:MAG: hypothetical protein AB7V27_08635 [Candidatus Binatia bacterium]